MKFFKKMKDGGPESTVTGYWLAEIKSLFSVVLLRFDGKSREAFHTHAFNSWSWVIKGSLTEEMLDGKINKYVPSIRPYTPIEPISIRSHRMVGLGCYLSVDLGLRPGKSIEKKNKRFIP